MADQFAPSQADLERIRLNRESLLQRFADATAALGLRAIDEPFVEHNYDTVTAAWTLRGFEKLLEQLEADVRLKEAENHQVTQTTNLFNQ